LQHAVVLLAFPVLSYGGIFLSVSGLFDYMKINIGTITLGVIVRSVILAVICLVVTIVILKVTDHAFRKIDFQQSLHGFIRATIKFILIFVSVLLVASSLGIEVTSLIAILSVAGLAVSLAVQNMLSNVAGGLQILSAKPYHVGEYIEVGGVAGTVSEIGVVYTKMKMVDNKLIYIPNSKISNEKIINYTSQENRRVDLEILVSYDAPIPLVKSTIQNVIAQHPKTLFTPEPLARVNAYQDSAVQYTVQAWCATNDYVEVRFDLLEQIKTAFDAEGIEMTYKHLNIHMIE
jgi:small conductance mechanosensitive channel